MSTASRTKRPILAVIVIVLVVVAGIGVYFANQARQTPISSTSMSSSTVTMPTTLVIDDSYVPSSMDPGTVIDNEGLQLGQNVNLPLVFCANTSCTKLVPVLATSWSGSSDGLTYTFVLRKGVYYNNGDPFNAYVVWWNIYRDLIINQASDFIFYIYFNTTGVTLDNVNSLNNAQNMPDSNLLQVMENPHNSVTVLNDSAVQFHLTNPFIPFMDTIETCPWVFVDPYVVEQHGGVSANQPNSWMSFNGTTFGDGPYITQVYVINEYNRLIANPNYWAQNLTGSDTNFILQPAKIPTIVVNYKVDELTRALDLEGGHAQAAVISFDDIKKVLSACPTCNIPDIGLSGSVEWIMLNSFRAPLNNTLVRRAIVAAVNLTQILQTVYNGYAVPFVGPAPVGWQYYDNSIQPPAYNVTLAKLLLAEAGYPNGEGLRPIEYVYPTSTYQSLVAQILKQDLAEIGITLTPKEVSGGTLATLLGIPGTNPSAPDMQINSWCYYADFSAYEYLADSQFGVVGNLRNATVYNLIIKSNTELDSTARGQEISQVMKDVQQSASIIWLAQDVDTFDTGQGAGPVVFNKCLAGMWYNAAFNGVDFNSLYYSCAP